MRVQGTFFGLILPLMVALPTIAQTLDMGKPITSAEGMAILQRLDDANRSNETVYPVFSYTQKVVKGTLVDINGTVPITDEACGVDMNYHTDEEKGERLMHARLEFLNPAHMVFDRYRTNTTKQYLAKFPVYLLASVNAFNFVREYEQTVFARPGFLFVSSDYALGQQDFTIEYDSDGRLIRVTVVDFRSTVYPKGFRMVCSFQTLSM